MSLLKDNGLSFNKQLMDQSLTLSRVGKLFGLHVRKEIPVLRWENGVLVPRLSQLGSSNRGRRCPRVRVVPFRSPNTAEACAHARCRFLTSASSLARETVKPSRFCRSRSLAFRRSQSQS